MLGFEPGEELAGRPRPSFAPVLESLADSLSCIGPCGKIEQALVGFRVLHDRRSPAFHREHDRSLALLELLHEVARLPAESGKGMNILSDVEHGAGLLGTFLGAVQVYSWSQEIVRAALFLNDLAEAVRDPRPSLA
jgi:hypothetical protein